MWVLVVMVWTLSNGEMRDHSFTATRNFDSLAECLAVGRDTSAQLVVRVEDSVGVGYMCGFQDPAPERHPGEMDA